MVALCPLLARSQNAPSAPPVSNQAAGSFSFGGGLTRDTLEEAARPLPPDARPRRSSTVARKNRAFHRRTVAPTAAVEHWPRPHRRNVFVSFIYAWNGWIIHTFHTTTGTVMLRRIGFKG